MDKERKGLRDKGVWRECDRRERSDVTQQARREGKRVQFGRVRGVCVETKL
jgi:hypothetical protein